MMGKKKTKKKKTDFTAYTSKQLFNKSYSFQVVSDSIFRISIIFILHLEIKNSLKKAFSSEKTKNKKL